MRPERSALDERGIGEREFLRMERRGRWIARALRLMGRLWRLDMGNWEETLRHPLVEGGPAIFCFWHQSMIVLSFSHRDMGFQILTSTSRDGVFLAEILKGLGNGAVYGSSSKGGKEALKELTRRVKEGASAAFAVDGPRGPRYRVKHGAAALAASTGRPLIPVAVAARPRKLLGSWDRTLAPLPGARVRLLADEPFRVPVEGGREAVAEASARLEESLMNLTARLDRELGQSTLPPQAREPRDG